MAFQTSIRGKRLHKFYCMHCGERLAREKIRRTVTPQDADYKEQLPSGHHGRPGGKSFSLRFSRTVYLNQNVNISDTRFVCPACKKRVPFDEQLIRARVQKVLGKRILTRGELESHREAAAKRKRFLTELKSMLFTLFFLALFVPVCKVLHWDSYIILLALIEMYIAIRGTVELIRLKNTPITETRDDEMHRLHARAYGNIEEVQAATVCHCFRCATSFSPDEIREWAEDGKTAACPNCRGTNIIPEDENDPIDGERLADIHYYWY